MPPKKYGSGIANSNVSAASSPSTATGPGVDVVDALSTELLPSRAKSVVLRELLDRAHLQGLTAVLIGATVAVWLPEGTAAAWLCLTAPLALRFAIGPLHTVQPEVAATCGGAARLAALKTETAEVERRRQEAVDGSGIDRDQIYRLRGELAALSGIEARTEFLLRSAGVDSLFALEEERQQLRGDCLEALRFFDEQKLKAGAAEEDVALQQERLASLQTDVEDAKSRRDGAISSKVALDAESDRSKTQSERLAAKVRSSDSELIRVRRELRIRGGEDSERKRLEAGVAAELEKKQSELKNEEQSLRKTLGNQRFVETVGKRLRAALEERASDIADLQRRLATESEEQQAVEEALAKARHDLDALCEAAPEVTESAEVPASMKDPPDDKLVGASGKKGKKDKKAKKKRADVEAADLEDLELELAAATNAAEKAEQDIARIQQEADERVSKAESAVAKGAVDRDKVGTELEAAEEAQERALEENRVASSRLAQRTERLEALESKLKELERDNIRLRVDHSKACGQVIGIEVGMRVELQGLRGEQAGMNGACGIVSAWNVEKGLWEVQADSGHVGLVEPQLLKPM